jgi:hypothetical protein
MAISVAEIHRYCSSTVVRTSELIDAGVSSSTIAHRCRPGGPWQRVLPGVVLLHNGPVDRDARRRAAVLHGGPGSVITGLDALALHGMQRMPNPWGPVHILVPADRRRLGAGRVLVERTQRLPDPVGRRWPLAPVARAAIDATRRLTDIAQVRATLAEVVQRGACRPGELIAELAEGSGRGSALPRHVLAEISDGVRSEAEARAREILASTSLPTAMWNVRIIRPDGRFLAVVDAWFDSVGVAWEIDSTEWHAGPAEYRRTLERHSELRSERIGVVHTAPRTLTDDRSAVVQELHVAVQDGARLGRPPVIAIPVERTALSSKQAG